MRHSPDIGRDDVEDVGLRHLNWDREVLVCRDGGDLCPLVPRHLWRCQKVDANL